MIESSIFGDVVAERLELLSYILVGLFVIIAVASIVHGLKKEKWKIPIAVIAITALMAFFIYSVTNYKLMNAEREGLTFCIQEGCFWAAHLHAGIEVNICKEEHKFPSIHFHDKIPIDSKGNLADATKLTVGEFMNRMNLFFNSTCIGTQCNGDLCPDESVGKLKMTVNGKENSKYDQYAWKDRDYIKIMFD